MTLSELFRRAAISPISARCKGDANLTGMTADSRAVESGNLFVAVRSSNTDTSKFIEGAVAKGATAVVATSYASISECERLGLPYIGLWASDQAVNAQLGRIGATITNDPTASMRVVGITGTNGKTTTAWLMRQALANLGKRAAYLGTLGYFDGESLETLENTTPFPVELANLLARARDRGNEYLVMEASSHALAQRRLAGVRFDVGIYTNLTQDHLDFHGTMAAYADAKKLLFTEYAAAGDKPFVAAINTDDETGRSWIADLAVPLIRFGESHAPDFHLTASYVGVDRLSLIGDSNLGEFEVPVGGLFNVENCRSAIAGLFALGFAGPEISQAMTKVNAVPGRFEPVRNDLGIGVIVDYAHTSDALEKLLASARDLAPARIITVFGCGGDRDRTKRPKMARAASMHSDITIVTSDNPRTEDPSTIISEVITGLESGSAHETVIDRRAAIYRAIRIAEPNDLVVIAGKGHEDYQIIGREKFPMDDRAIAREALAERGSA